MSKPTIKIVNLSGVVNDFKDYDKNTTKEFRKLLTKYAQVVKRKQYSLLKSQVIDWTGFLGNSIGVTKKGLSRSIGPSTRYEVDYAEFIESGGYPYGNTWAGRFPGYWYVKRSLTGIKARFRADINKVLTSLQKK